MSQPRKPTRQGYVDALIELAAQMPELVVLDADVAKATKTCDFEQEYPHRFFNCGAAEQNELSVAAGGCGTAAGSDTAGSDPARVVAARRGTVLVGIHTEALRWHGIMGAVWRPSIIRSA